MQLFIPYYALLCLSVASLYQNSKKFNWATSYLFVSKLFLFYVVVVSLRDFDMLGDTRAYLGMFSQVRDGFFDLISTRIEPGFVLLLNFFSLLDLTDRQFLFAIATFQVSLWFFALKTYFAKPATLLLSVFIFISMFFYYNLGANVLRQALAIPFLILAFHYIFKGELLKLIMVALLAATLHKTTIGIIIIVFFVTKLNFKITTSLAIMLIITFLSASGINDKISGFVAASLFQGYSYIWQESSVELYRVGFRLDFWLFTMLPVVLYYLLTDEGKVLFKVQFNSYLLIFSLFIFMFSLPYSDRTGIYCWTFGCLLMADFSGYYRFNILNSKSLMVSVIGLFGILSFLFYKTLNFNYMLENLM
ncbi:hypothetical protein KAM474_17750 [Aeromonas caviae]|uniref:EpsG family protein n=1 Tax=Aeromonas caviae TaxID=648 RepID=UPI001FC8A974|nr:EpsG family protein [Aeromonas caviae]GKR48357.1 hypothetical protein KAM474_17750 [Aeromonas caviae]